MTLRGWEDLSPTQEGNEEEASAQAGGVFELRSLSPCNRQA